MDVIGCTMFGDSYVYFRRHNDVIGQPHFRCQLDVMGSVMSWLSHGCHRQCDILGAMVGIYCMIYRAWRVTCHTDILMGAVFETLHTCLMGVIL